MNKLFFVRASSRNSGDVTFLFTATDEAEATAKCLAGIADFCRAEFTVNKCELVCLTPDTVDGFEPV